MTVPGPGRSGPQCNLPFLAGGVLGSKIDPSLAIKEIKVFFFGLQPRPRLSLWGRPPISVRIYYYYYFFLFFATVEQILSQPVTCRLPDALSVLSTLPSPNDDDKNFGRECPATRPSSSITDCNGYISGANLPMHVAGEVSNGRPRRRHRES